VDEPNPQPALGEPNNEWREPEPPLDKDGLTWLREGEQRLVENISEWLRESSEKRQALIVFPDSNVGEIMFREMAQTLDLFPERGRRLRDRDGTILEWMAWTPELLKGRRYDAIFLHPSFPPGDDTHLHYALAPCSGKLIFA
jgi:hypothetical protein